MRTGLLRAPARAAIRHYPLLSGGASLAARPPLRRLAPAGPEYVATLRDGTRLLVDPRDFIGRAVALTGDYDPKLSWLCERALRPGDTMLDVGANQGIVTARAARLVGPAGRVHAFEPQSRLAELLRRSMALNGYDHVRVHAVALSDADGRLALRGTPGSTATASLTGGGEALEEVGVRRADAVLAELGLGRIRLLKLDVEGHESAFLEGARSYLEANPPDVLAFESHGPVPFGERPAVRAVRALGYDIFQIPKALLTMRLVPVRGDRVQRGFDFVGLRPGGGLADLLRAR